MGTLIHFVNLFIGMCIDFGVLGSIIPNILCSFVLYLLAPFLMCLKNTEVLNIDIQMKDNYVKEIKSVRKINLDKKRFIMKLERKNKI